MKKFLAILLAAMLVLSMTAVAFADDGSTVTPSATKEFEFQKFYKISEDSDDVPAVLPDEVLSFTVDTPKNEDGSTQNPDDTMITIAEHSVIDGDDETSDNPSNVVVTIPSYSKVGTYKYTVTEAVGNTQGVTYNTTSFDVEVTVSYATNEVDGSVDYTRLVSEAHITSVADGSKITSITNYYHLGTLTVEKNVAGNLASRSQLFRIHVEFTSDQPVLSAITGADTIAVSAWDYDEDKDIYTASTEITLAHGDQATFNNIPVGVEWVVYEDESHSDEDTNGSDSSKGYAATYKVNDAAKAVADVKGDISANGETDAVEILNTKGTDINTGITVDSLPYVLLMGIVLLAGAAMIIKRRAHNN